MDIRFQAGGPEKWKGDVTLIPLSEGEQVLKTCPELDELAPYLEIAPAMCDVHGRKGETALVYGHPKLPMPRVMFLGLGKGAVDMDGLREAFAVGVRKAKELRLSSVIIPAFVFKRYGDVARALEEAVCGCMLGDYAFTKLKHLKDDDEKPLSWLAIGEKDAYFPEELRVAARKGENDAAAVMDARDLISLPANMLTPEIFADKVVEAADGLPLRCTVMDEQALMAAGHNAHVAVGQGGANAPRLVILEYASKGHEDDKPLVLVGKGITFDSGGISLKPAAKMHLMKSDMTGAADVFAALCAIARESVEGHVVGLMALAENMPDGRAVHPGDVVTGLSGDTIEIVNADAEGRLVLADTLVYARTKWQPKAIVDIATLTGACAVALGDQLAGLFASDDALAEAVAAAGRRGGENFWRLPLWAGYRKKLDSPCADICHTATREGGAITAAVFLQNFVGEGIPWAHLDIAGVDWVESDTSLCPEGPTAFGARTLLELGRGGAE